MIMVPKKPHILHKGKWFWMNKNLPAPDEGTMMGDGMAEHSWV
jgi:hypothetical protein